jgi:3-hydroxy-3-methylglutaryl CoA synthase
MAGISSYGAYIPFHRLSRAEIARAWESAPAPGERAIASFDEDSLTMGVEAALDCTKEVAKESIDGLFFASTSSPYKDKQSAATIAMVLGLNENTVTMDFGGSFRCGTNALRAAVDMVKSGSAKNILVIASELRLAYPSGPFEMNFGDGAVAVLVSDTGVIAEIENYYSVFEELQDIWRSDRDTFTRSAEDRFIIDSGFNRIVPKAVSDAMKKFNLTQKDFTHCVLYIPNQRQVPGLVKRLGFDPKTQSKDGLYAKVGDAGAAMALMLLVETLEEAKADNRILLVNYGNGCDVFSIKTSAGIDNARGNRRAVQGYTASKTMLSNYNRYLRWHELVMIQPPARPALEIRQPAPQAQWRENKNVFRLRGTKCNHCGTPQYPPQRVCVVCRTKDDFEYYSFVDKKAKIYTFSHDFIMQTADPPVTVAMVDFEGGGRMMCDVTDRNPEQVKVGMPVEMTFRRLYYVGGIYNYWWKARPIR